MRGMHMAQNEDSEDDVYASMICDDGSWQVRSTGGDQHSRAVDTFNAVSEYASL